MIVGFAMVFVSGAILRVANVAFAASRVHVLLLLLVLFAATVQQQRLVQITAAYGAVFLFRFGRIQLGFYLYNRVFVCFKFLCFCVFVILCFCVCVCLAVNW